MSVPGRTLSLVINDLLGREEKGVQVYGTTVDRSDLSLNRWLLHAYEEALDLAVYLRRVLDMEVGDDLVDCRRDVVGAVDCASVLGAGVQDRTRLSIDSRVVRMDPTEMAVYVRMLYCADPDGIVPVSTLELSRRYGLAPKTVQTAIKALERLGWIVVERNGRGTRYRLTVR